MLGFASWPALERGSGRSAPSPYDHEAGAETAAARLEHQVAVLTEEAAIPRSVADAVVRTVRPTAAPTDETKTSPVQTSIKELSKVSSAKLSTAADFFAYAEGMMRHICGGLPSDEGMHPYALGMSTKTRCMFHFSISEHASDEAEAARLAARFAERGIDRYVVFHESILVGSDAARVASESGRRDLGGTRTLFGSPSGSEEVLPEQVVLMIAGADTGEDLTKTFEVIHSARGQRTLGPPQTALGAASPFAALVAPKSHIYRA